MPRLHAGARCAVRATSRSQAPRDRSGCRAARDREDLDVVAHVEHRPSREKTSDREQYGEKRKRDQLQSRCRETRQAERRDETDAELNAATPNANPITARTGSRRPTRSRGAPAPTGRARSSRAGGARAPSPFPCGPADSYPHTRPISWGRSTPGGGLDVRKGGSNSFAVSRSRSPLRMTSRVPGSMRAHRSWSGSAVLAGGCARRSTDCTARRALAARTASSRSRPRRARGRRSGRPPRRGP